MLLTRLTAAEVRRQLIAQKGYTDQELPTEETIASKLNDLMDAKATLKVGPFGRGGKSRVTIKTADHDFEPVATVTSVGILSLPPHLALAPSPARGKRRPCALLSS